MKKGIDFMNIKQLHQPCRVINAMLLMIISSCKSTKISLVSTYRVLLMISITEINAHLIHL